jgi:hypothetical protein
LSIEVLSKKDGDQVVGTGLLLRGFSFESRRAGADLLIEAGPPSAPVVHYVHHPLKVWIAETGLGAESDIMVESDRGVTTLIRLRRLPALPSSGRRRT